MRLPSRATHFAIVLFEHPCRQHLPSLPQPNITRFELDPSGRDTAGSPRVVTFKKDLNIFANVSARASSPVNLRTIGDLVGYVFCSCGFNRTHFSVTTFLHKSFSML